MATLSIRMSLDSNGKLTQDPDPARVDPGDTVSWTSDDGDLALSFASDSNPFTSHGVLIGPKGHRTPPVIVRNDVPIGAHFECTVKLGGKTFQHASGVDTPGSSS